MAWLQILKMENDRSYSGLSGPFTNTIEGWEWYFHPTLHDGYDNLHLLGLKFNHVDESIP